MINQTLLGQYKELHAKPHVFTGLSLLRHVKQIYRLIKKHRAKTLLDYGCGKGTQYTLYNANSRWFYNWGIMPTLYDPAYEPFANKPIGKFDGVICTDVMEHIPEEEVDAVLTDTIGYANKFVFFNICVRPAKKFLPDGRNVHLTVRPKEWWEAKLSAYCHLETQLVCTE